MQQSTALSMPYWLIAGFTNISWYVQATLLPLLQLLSAYAHQDMTADLAKW